MRSPEKRAVSIHCVGICLALTAVVFAIYGQVAHHDFVRFDDDVYLSSNPEVSRGLRWSGLIWAFTTFHASNWHPLTW
ncbi:MAG: hypothetical protein KC729_21330, partial [Candidatus Eisenbacteria bacterium]|nr:hypothetical protein [Candidatus Eisenbacteria bacterium]